MRFLPCNIICRKYGTANHQFTSADIDTVLKPDLSMLFQRTYCIAGQGS